MTHAAQARAQGCPATTDHAVTYLWARVRRRTTFAPAAVVQGGASSVR